MSLPETFTTIKAKMNSNVKFAIENMNTALEEMCSDIEVKPKDKLRATQDYLALYLRLENEIAREQEQKEVMKVRRLNTKIKQAEVAALEGDEQLVPSEISISKFSPTMSVN